MNACRDMERAAVGDWARLEGYMALRTCQHVQGGLLRGDADEPGMLLIGEDERLSYFSLEEQDNHESFSPGPSRWLDVQEAEESAVGLLYGDEEWDAVARQWDRAEARATRHLKQQRRKRRQAQRQQRRLEFQHLRALEEVAANLLRGYLVSAKTKADIYAVSNRLANYEASLPSWFETYIWDWLAPDFDRAASKVEKLAKEAAKRAARLAKARRAGLSEIHHELTEEQKLSQWLMLHHPRSARFNGGLYSWAALRAEEKMEVARSALKLPMQRAELGAVPRVAAFLLAVQKKVRYGGSYPVLFAGPRDIVGRRFDG